MRATVIFILAIFFTNNLACQTIFPYRQKDKWFFVNDSLKPISKKTYSFVFPFQGSRAIVKQGNKFGAVDNRENVIIPCVHDTIISVSPNFLCRDNGVPTWLDYNGKVFKPESGVCGGSHGTVSMFNTYKKNNKIGLLVFDPKGAKADTLPNIYSKVIEIATNVGVAKLGDKWGIINSAGKTITSFTLDSIDVYDDSFDSPYFLFKYFNGNAVGFIDKTGKIMTEPRYKDRYFLIGKFTLIKTRDGKLGWLDNLGREYFKP